MGVLRYSCPAWLAFGITLSLQACSAAGQNGSTPEGQGAAAPTGTAGTGPSVTPHGGTTGGPDLGTIDTMAGSSSGPPGEQCATAQAEAPDHPLLGMSASDGAVHLPHAEASEAAGLAHGFSPEATPVPATIEAAVLA